MQLDSEQQMALNAMLAGESIFLTGRAGTGKSTVINAFLQRHPSNLVCVAPTGMAARNLDHAMTIHRCFELPIGIPSPLRPTHQEHSNPDLLKSIQSVLIDEISMVRSDVLAAVEALLRRHAPSGKQRLPFGGRQIIVVGDFYQLPPVVTTEAEAEYLESRYGGAYAFNAPAWRIAAFRKIELTKIYRQIDRRYIEFLNEIRTCGSGLPDWLGDIKQRVRPDFAITAESDTICLCCRRQDAEAINEQAMAQLTDPGVVLDGCIRGVFPADELPTAQKLRIKRGARVMLQGNLRSRHNADHYHYVNGDTGTVQDYGINGESVVVQLDRGSIVTVKPAQWEHYEYTTWHDEADELQITQKEVGLFRQLPLAPAYAMTIHKAQGQTLDKTHLILGNGCFAPGQLYTALSRVRSLQDLTLDRPIRLSEAFCDAMIEDFSSQP